MSAPERLRSVAILGGGLTGLTTAMALHRALPELALTIVDLHEQSDALTDRLPGALPTIHRFHRELGIDGDMLLARGVAAPRLGVRFENGAAANGPWIASFGKTGEPLGSLPFHQLWVRAADSGLAEPYHRFSLAGLLTERGGLPGGALPLAVDWGLNLDVERYCALLREVLSGGRVTFVHGAAGRLEYDPDGLVTCYGTDAGVKVEADLYIDCAGPGASMDQGDAAFVSWVPWLPAGAIRLVRRASGEPVLRDEASAAAEGWQVIAHAPAATIECFFTASGGAQSEGDLIRIAPGRRSRAWTGNVVALGDAACMVDPLLATNLHLVQASIRLLLAHLPDCRFVPENRDEFNRRWANLCDRVRDMLALHHAARAGSLRPEALPPTLAHTLEQFARRGRLPVFEEESFTPDAWTTALLALGTRPALAGAITAALDDASVANHLARVRAGLERELAAPR